ncbi:MAG: hypothetical protein Q8L23_15735 [Caulobacter sp.]|nr:hypothetical protein [Caulobacter sp.]
MADISAILDAAEDTPWAANEHGLWCPACGHHIAAPWNIDDDYVAPESCRECGFPEFGG